MAYCLRSDAAWCSSAGLEAILLLVFGRFFLPAFQALLGGAVGGGWSLALVPRLGVSEQWF